MVDAKYITVPKNDTGVREYKSLIEESDNLINFTLPEDEYEKLDKHHVFDILNERFGLMIDICESETVAASQLKQAYQEISLFKGVWLEAVDKAIAFGTCVFLDF